MCWGIKFKDDRGECKLYEPWGAKRHQDFISQEETFLERSRGAQLKRNVSQG